MQGAGWLDEELFVKSLRDWAEANGSVKELWLFGSRAKGTSRFESDVDIAVALMPAQGRHNWALGNYVDQQPQWKEQLETIVGRKVDLCLILPDTSLDVEVRMTGKLLWTRG
jgi:predicted nucleotidyltransferase